MKRSHVITIAQARRLREVKIYPFNIDSVIDEIRRRFNVIIYNTAPPHVSPISNKIIYGFSVKVCNTKWGWNARKYLGQTKWRTNIYQAKRKTINIAIKWILSHKSQKSKKPKIVAINANSKKKQN